MNTATKQATRKARLSDAEWTSRLLTIGDELEGRLFIGRIEPRPNEIMLTIRDRDSNVARRISISRDADLSDIRKRILTESADVLLQGDTRRKRA